ncbi:hypothetical protein CDAR_236641 [Caerostris darwini]|uniref:Uncharacterized protein n=1 Tax=Caerostris darwini TaxID=1538125 RepID=A0AAV4VPB1_9ARAC|nr:hypothetical protein CDAR_236641 [Caerostris darwini]
MTACRIFNIKKKEKKNHVWFFAGIGNHSSRNAAYACPLASFFLHASDLQGQKEDTGTEPQLEDVVSFLRLIPNWSETGGEYN